MKPVYSKTGYVLILARLILDTERLASLVTLIPVAWDPYLIPHQTLVLR